MITDLFHNIKIEGDAAFSDDGHYRWSLSRVWGPMSGRPDWVGWIMLNPSTADATTNDQTIRKCIVFSDIFGSKGLSVRNLFNWRSTDPRVLETIMHPVAPPDQIDHANRLIVEMFDVCTFVIAAWGRPGHLLGRDREIYKLIEKRGYLDRLYCLGTNQDGSPKHPLYLANVTPLKPFRMAVTA